MIQISEDDKARLYELEVSLWRPETRFDDDYLDEVLAEDFFEFGRSGRIYQRADTMGVPAQDIDIELPLDDFQAHPIAEDVVLVTYVSKVHYDELEIGNRSSLWVREDGDWKLRFHQGTPADEKRRKA